ncbi:MAG: isoprenylcysteine carboxylmethyltransferase family protein [Xanthobacteraceae bacterium]
MVAFMPISAYVQSAVFLVLAAVALFACAGTLAIAGFWLFLAILAGVTGASLAILDPDLIRERMRPGGRRAPLGLRLVGLIPLLQLIIAGLDRGRLHWSDSVPPWLQGAGLAAVAGGFALFLWAMAVNPFFSSVARIQAERGQHVIAAGPYRFVRHPGYSGAILLILASGLALGSWLATAFVVVLGMPLILHRTITEDRLLHAELAGYRDYAGRIRWRVAPGIW